MTADNGLNAAQRRKIGRALQESDDRDRELKRLSKHYGVSTHALAVIWREWFVKKLERQGARPMGQL